MSELVTAKKYKNITYKFSELFDLSEIQILQDSFSAATGVASVITEPDGTPITQPSGFCSLCKEIRKTAKGLENCLISDSIIGSPAKDGPKIQRCLSGGLIDGGASIIVKGQHIANWLIGQVLDEDYELEDLLPYADVIGIKRNVYRNELIKVKRMSKLQFDNVCNFLFLNAQQLSKYAVKNILLTQEINEKVINEKKVNSLNDELEKQRNFLKQMLNVIPDLIFYKDTAGVYLGSNKSFAEKFIGLREDEIIGKKYLDFANDGELARLISQKDKVVLEQGVTKANEETVTLADGMVIELETMRSPFFDENGKVAGLIGISRNITERKRIEKELLKSKIAAEEASAIKSQFLANMSHEIRTPMNGVMGMLQLLELTKLTEDQANYIRISMKSSDLLLKVINDILDYSKIEARKLKIEKLKFNLNEFIREIETMFKPSVLNKGLVLNLLIENDVPHRLLGDSFKLRQVLSNIIGNAIKFTKKGRIDLIVRKIEERNNEVKLEWVVQDTGLGLSQNNLKDIFNSFSQADGSITRQYGGTGLGLPICKGLVELMQGEIWVESTEGKGSSFFFTSVLEKFDEEENQLDANELYTHHNLF